MNAETSARPDANVTLSPGAWAGLILSATVTAILSLGVHDMMLTRLHIAYPYHDAVPAWARYIDTTVRLASLVWFCRISHPTLTRMGAVPAALVVGLMLVFLNETLRVFAVDIYLTKGWLERRWMFTLADSLPAAIILFAYGALATVFARRWASGALARTAIAILATTALGSFGLKPALQASAARIESALRVTQPPELYALPYPFHVYRVIYGMFIEPTIAAFVLVAIVWRYLPGSASRRVAAFVGLILLIRGRFVMESLFSFWVPEPLGAAFLSESQFFLETLVLALLSGITWALVARQDRATAVATGA